MKRVVVVGGGVAGLATAALLAREGHPVRLLEKNERLGGRAGLVQRDGFRFDAGPSWYLMPNVFEHFFELMGTTSEDQLDLQQLDPGYRVYAQDAGGNTIESVTIPAGTDRVVELFDRIEPGSGARLERYLRSGGRAALMAERYFLYNPFTSVKSLLAPEVVRALPELGSLLVKTLDSFISRRFSNPVLQKILGFPAVFLGTSPYEAPAIYHLMSALDLDQGVLYPRGGFWTFVERLEQITRNAGVNVVTGATATGIKTFSTGKRHLVSGVKWRGQDGASHFEPADIVVSAADLHHTETRLLTREAQSYPEAWWQKRQSGPGAVIALLGVQGELPALGHHTLFFTHDWTANFQALFGSSTSVPNPTSLYVCKPSATDTNVAPEGHENLFVLVPVPADVSLGHGGADGGGDPQIERIVDAAIDQIATWASIPDIRQRITVRQTIGPADFANDYNSWRGGMLGPSHILRQSAMFRAQNQSKRVDGLYYAGASTAPGVGVPMCLISAELVLKRVRGDHSPGPTMIRSSAGNRRSV